MSNLLPKIWLLFFFPFQNAPFLFYKCLFLFIVLSIIETDISDSNSFHCHSNNLFYEDVCFCLLFIFKLGFHAKAIINKFRYKLIVIYFICKFYWISIDFFISFYYFFSFLFSCFVNAFLFLFFVLFTCCLFFAKILLFFLTFFIAHLMILHVFILYLHVASYFWNSSFKNLHYFFLKNLYNN